MSNISTTLMQANLSVDTIQYTFNSSNQFLLRIKTNGNHNIYGSVKVNLANCFNYSVKTEINSEPIPNYFNTQTLIFRKSGSDTLDCLINWLNGSNNVAYTDTFVDLNNNGTNITAAVNNLFIELLGGFKKALAIDNVNSNFVGTNSGSLRFQTTTYLNNSGENKIVEVVNDILNLNNQYLSSQFNTKIEIIDYTADSKVVIELR